MKMKNNDLLEIIPCSGKFIITAALNTIFSRFSEVKRWQPLKNNFYDVAAALAARGEK